MSREFGDYHAPGYFHDKLENAAEDASEGHWEPTRMMEPLLRALYDAARVCATVEAHDSSPGTGPQHDWLRAMRSAQYALESAIKRAQAETFE